MIRAPAFDGLALVMLLIALSAGLAAGRFSSPSIPIVLRPAAEPIPALKYRLLPERSSLVPGNAAVFYHRAIEMLEEAMAERHGGTRNRETSLVDRGTSRRRLDHRPARVDSPRPGPPMARDLSDRPGRDQAGRATPDLQLGIRPAIRRASSCCFPRFRKCGR